MTTTASIPHNVLHTAYQKSVAEYWNTNQDDPVNLRLGDVDGLYHHHYGIGSYDPSVLEGPSDTRDDRIIKEMHRLETMQANLLLDHLGDISPDDQLLDAGSGRGGTSLMAHQRFGCRVDGVTISEYQVEFANSHAQRWAVADRVKFYFRNMLSPDSRRDRAGVSGLTRPPCTWTCSSCSPSSPASWSTAVAMSASPVAITT